MSSLQGEPPSPDFRSLFEAAPGCFLVLAPDAPRFTILAASDAYLRATGTRREAIVGLGVFDVFPDNPAGPSGAGASRRASFERVIARRLPDQEALPQHETRRQGEDGRPETRVRSPLNSPVLDEHGEVRYIIHRVADVTELALGPRRTPADGGTEADIPETDARVDVASLRREADAARECESPYAHAQDALRRLELVASHSRDIFLFMRRDDGRLLEANAAAIEAYGYDRDELLRLTIHDLRAAETRATTAGQMAVADEGGILFETVHRRKDGSTFPVEVSSRGALVEGTPTLVSVIRDISRRKTAEEALRRSEALLRMQIERMPIGCMLHDAQFRVSHVNPAAEGIFGYTAAELVGQHAEVLVPEASRAQVDGILRRLAQGDMTAHSVNENVTKDGRTIVCQWTNTPLRDPGGAFLGVLSMVQDVSDRQRADEALRESEQRLMLAEQAARVGTFDWNVETGVNIWSPELEAMYGLKPGEFARTQPAWEQLVHPEDRAAALKAVEQAFETCLPVESEWRVVWPDGSQHWLMGRFQVFGGSAGKQLRLVGVNIDMTERKQAEDALRRAEARWNAAIEHLGEGAIFATEAGQLVYWNPAARKLHGFTSADEGLGPLAERASIFQLWTPDGQHLLSVDEWPMTRILRGEAVRHVELRLRRLDQGWEKFVSYSGGIVDTASGERLVYLSVYDLTEQRRVEQALRESELFYRQTLESIPGMVFTTRPDGYCDYQSQQWVDFTGVPMSEHLGDGWNRLLHPDDRPRVFEAWRAAVEERAAYDLDYRVRRRDGQYEWFKVRGAPIRDAQGRIVRWFGVAANIDAIKRAEEDLAAAKVSAEHAKSAAESASRAKDQFIAVLSHELRTPLTPAVAAMSLLRTDVRLPADVRSTLAMVSRNLDLEVRLIADLLDVSRIISGRMHLEKRPVDVASVIREAAAIVASDLEAQGQTLSIETQGAPYLALADAARLQQVFWNLLRNSIKFSPARSHIAIRAGLVAVERCPLVSETCAVGLGKCPLPVPVDDEGPRAGRNLVVEVVDQGSGIDAQMLPRLFDVFEQEQKARSFGGLGLGLSICKAVVEMHGGEISAYSEGTGRGATFTVRLPVAQCALASSAALSDQAATAGASTRRPDGKRPLRVLLVEDHADTAEMMCLLLTMEGHEVVTASRVAEALAAVEAAAPDILISDLGLPDGSGLDLIRDLRARGVRVPAIALSGYGTSADIELSKAAGFGEHLVKPLNGVEPLAAAIARLGVGRGRET